VVVDSSSATVDDMSEVSGTERIEDVAAGDIIVIVRGSGERAYKVVFKDATEAGYVLTLQDDGGETFQLDFDAGDTVRTSLQSKWESAQSPTPHAES
jgi:hypothetical protein